MKKDELSSIILAESIDGAIHFIRGNKVLLDKDLSRLYGVATSKLVQAVKRNITRFPEDFMFQLSKDELKNWMSQIVISNPNVKMGLRKRPYAFTEQGVAMLSGILRSPQAVKVNIEIMRAFVRIRHTLASLKDVTKELSELKSFLLRHSHTTDREFKRIWQTIEKLSKPNSTKEQRKIGFDLKQ